MLEAYIYDGARTPFGRHAGALSKVRPDDMLAGVIKDTETDAAAATDDWRRDKRSLKPHPLTALQAALRWPSGRGPT